MQGNLESIVAQLVVLAKKILGINPLHFVCVALHSVRLHLNTGTHTLAHLIPSSPGMPVLFWLVRNVSIFLTSKTTLFRKALGDQVYSDL